MSETQVVRIEDLVGVKIVAKTMVDHGLPRMPELSLVTIGTSEGENFKRALVSVANNADEGDKAKNYIYQVCSLLTAPAQTLLASLGFAHIPGSVFIRIGKECSAEFRGKLHKAAQGDALAIKWIEAKILEHSGGATTQPAQDAKPAAAHPSTAARPPSRQQQSQPQQPARPQPSRTAAAEQARPEGEDGRDFVSVHLYGGKFALCFGASHFDGLHSINLDAGAMFQGQRKVDWQNAIHFRFTERELFSMIALFIGCKDEIKFDAHGPQNDKSFAMKRQSDGFYASCAAKDMGQRGVPFAADEGVRLLTLAIRQCLLNHPEHTVESLLFMIRTVMGQPRRSAPAPAAQPHG